MKEETLLIQYFQVQLSGQQFPAPIPAISLQWAFQYLFVTWLLSPPTKYHQSEAEQRCDKQLTYCVKVQKVHLIEQL